MGTLQAYIVDISKPENRARNLGISGAAFGLGAIAGPALGGGLMGLGLNVPVFVAAGLSCYNLISASVLLPETIPLERRKPVNLEAINIFKPIGKLLRQQKLRRIAIAFALFNICFSAYISLLVLKQQYSWTPFQTSGLFVIVGITLTVAQLSLIGKAVRVFGEFNVNRLGMLSAAAGVLLLAIAPFVGPLQTTTIVISGVVLAIGTAFVLPTSRSLVSGLAPADQQGAILGSLASLTGIASVIGPNTAGWLYDFSPIACFGFEALASIIGALLLGRQSNSYESATEMNVQADQH
jgi:MFS family permease